MQSIQRIINHVQITSETCQNCPRYKSTGNLWTQTYLYIIYIYIYKGKTKTIFIENISAIHRIFKKVKKNFQNISTFCETFNYVEWYIYKIYIMYIYVYVYKHIYMYIKYLMYYIHVYIRYSRKKQKQYLLKIFRLLPFSNHYYQQVIFLLRYILLTLHFDMNSL